MDGTQTQPPCETTNEGSGAANGRRPDAAIWRGLRWLVALSVIAFWGWVFLEQISRGPMVHSLAFEDWYGGWRNVWIVSGVFLAFLLGFAWPRGRAEWRNTGMYSAFLVSLFVEMFGVPLTIFVVAPLLDVPVLDFGLNESHLWAYLLDRAGLVPLVWGVYGVMIVSLGLIALGLALVAVGWAQVYGVRYGMVTWGLYRVVRHPQYLGFILVIIAFNIQWPTLLTLLMAPVLIVMYVRQARHEDRELARRFGEAFLQYASRVPAFIPRLTRRVPSSGPTAGGA